MTVSFNNNLGVWQVNGRGAYGSKEAAQAADESAAQVQVVDDADFAANFGQAPRVLAPERTTSTVTTPEQAKERQDAFERSSELHRQGYSDLNGDGTINDVDLRLSGVAYGTPISQGGSATGYQVTQTQLGKRDSKPINGHPTVTNYVVTGLPDEGADGFRASYSYTNTPGGGGTKVKGFVGSLGAKSTGVGAPGGSTSDQRDQQSEAAAENAGAQFQNEREQNSFENDNLFADAMARFDALGGPNNQLSDEARRYQQEGLAQQRMLLEELLGFDEQQYAAQFADQALARQIALGRASGTSAAAQQAGIFAAQEQAPALYAEGARQAAGLANQRLGLAEQAAKSFGELGTMTRGQDEARAQFEAQLPLEIANSVAELTQGKMALNQQDSQMFAEIWMDFARLQSVYAGMSSDEQIAWWQNETARRGQDKQFEAIMEGLKAQGRVTSKDLINGLFQLGGGLLGIAGRVGAE